MHIKHGVDKLRSHGQEPLVPKDPGVVHDDVDPAPVTHGGVDHRRRAVQIAHTVRVGHGRTTSGDDLVDDPLGCPAIVTRSFNRPTEVVHNHSASARCEKKCMLAA